MRAAAPVLWSITPVTLSTTAPVAGEALQLPGYGRTAISGDGNILLVDCTTPVEGDIGLLKVWTTDEAIGADGLGKVCFQLSGTHGLLYLEVPGVYEIRGDGQTAGSGHEVTAGSAGAHPMPPAEPPRPACHPLTRSKSTDATTWSRVDRAERTVVAA